MTSNALFGSGLVGVLLAIFLGGAAWIIAGSPAGVPRHGVSLPSPAPGEPVYITVEPGDSAADIGRRLEEAGVIESAASFQRLARITGRAGNLAAGEYEFAPGTSALDALVRIRAGLTAARIVTVPEGLRMEEVAALLEKRGVLAGADFLAAANALARSGTDIDPDLLASRPAAATLEGYLFPATYSFRRNVTPEEVVLAMVDALSERFTPELRAEARAQGLSVHQVLTLASIIQREVVLPEELPIAASVYRNRLKIDMPLQADPTVQYAIAARPGSVVEFGYWKRGLTEQDLAFESAYNTYTRRGLPPGPIANPGLEAIIAVIRPRQTAYLYFVARNDGSGGHAFAETLAEHERNVARYQR